MKELARQGHVVYLIGNPLSQVDEFGINLIPLQKKDLNNWEKFIPKNIDIIHLSANYKPKTDIPYIITVHGNGQPGEVFPKNSVFLSKKHAESHNATAYIYNGIDLEEYPFTPKQNQAWENFFFLGKGSWSVKNLKQCIQVTKRNKKHLHIIGGRSFIPSRYIHSYGPLGGEEKLDVMNKCDALLFPVLWHEPFGIAIIEAMALGKPVIGSPYGSLPELINEETGFICNNYEDLTKIVKNNTKKFDPEKIRDYVEKNFAIKKYTQENINLYENIINYKQLNENIPSWVFNKRAESQLSC
jgi:glycosyltransferase involved in cell wall biosynthesis